MGQLGSSISAWSSQGLIAHYTGKKVVEVMLIDPVVGFDDPFYCQKLKVKKPEEAIVLLQWNSSGTHLFVAYKSGSIEIFRQRVPLKLIYQNVSFIFVYLGWFIE